MMINLIILIILLLLSAFFSATEAAFISLTQAKVQAMVKKNLPRAKQIKKLKSNPRRLLITILIGNNIVNIAAASLATVVASQLFASAVIGITTGVMTLLVLIFGEIIPKSYAVGHNKKLAIFSAPYVRFLQIILWPFIIIFEFLTKIFTGGQREEKISEEEVRALAMAGAKQGNIEEDESMMIERLFKFNDITAEDVMTPRVQVSYIDENTTIEKAAEIIEKSVHTRFPIIKGTPDHITGFVHSRDVLVAYRNDKEDKPIKNIIHPIFVVPKQMRIDDLLREFQKKQTHMAVVLDEHGGTEGIATLEDVLEELVGEITDEHDISENMIKRLDKNTIVVAGGTVLRDINDFFNCNIPGDPLDTIAEIILDELKRMPRKNTMIEIGDVICTVSEVKKKKISKVKIKKN